MANATNWSNPVLAAVDHGADAADLEPCDASTVDPSHIIHLIRQLLPNNHGVHSSPLEHTPEGVGAVLDSKAVAIVSDSIKQNVLNPDEGGKRLKNGNVLAGRSVEELPTEQEHPLRVLSASFARESSTIGQSRISCDEENRVKLESYVLHPEQMGNYTQENSELSGRNGNAEAGLQQKVHIPAAIDASYCETSNSLSDISSPAIRADEAQGNLGGKILDLKDEECPKSQVMNDGLLKPGGDENAREEAGCVLWDLAATESHANFLVEHNILDILLAFLIVPRSDRMTEICLGVFGNLACHPGPVKAMVSKDVLVDTVVQQLFLESIPCLTETCRLLSAGLHSELTARWVESLKPESVLERIFWIANNTLDPQLLEKCIELILLIVDARKDASSVLFPSLLRLGLPGLLVDLIECEISDITEGTSSRGDVILDTVLQIAEALSTTEESAAQLAASDEIFSMSCQVVRLSIRDEIGPSGITAVVLIANLLTENPGLIEKVLNDPIFLGRLLALVPSAGEDPGARNALWSILGRFCSGLLSARLEDPQYSTSVVLAVLADGCSLLLDDLEVHQEDVEEDDDQALAGPDAAASTSRGLQAKLSTVLNLKRVMEQWNAVHGGNSSHDTQLFRSVRKARMLLQKHISVTEM